MPLIPFYDTLSSLRNCGSNSINGIKLNDFERFQVFSYAAFSFINIVTVIFTCMFMLIIRYTDTVPMRMINMTNHCDAEEYNVTLIDPPSTFFMYFSIILLFSIAFITTLCKNLVLTPIKANAGKRIAGELLSIAVHFFLFCIMMELIKLITGIPSPYFFSNQELKHYYCSDEFTMIIQPYETIKDMDKYLRRSFPSYRAAILSFCTTFLYLYVEHFDIANGLHTTQQVILLFFGGISMHLLLNHIERGENHVNDVVAGIIIGFFYGMLTIRNLFGSVLYQRTHKWIIEEQKYLDKATENDSQSSELITLNNGRTVSGSSNNRSRSNAESVNLNEIVVTPTLHTPGESGHLRSSSEPYDASTSAV